MYVYEQPYCNYCFQFYKYINSKKFDKKYDELKITYTLICQKTKLP